MKILVIRFSSLGDLVTLEPIFRAVRNLYKDAQIDFLSTIVGISLYEDAGYFNNFYQHDSIIKSAKSIRERYDYIFNLQCNKPSHFVAKLIKNKKTLNISYSLRQKIFGLSYRPKSWPEFFMQTGLSEAVLNEYFSLEENALVNLPASAECGLIKKSKQIRIGISTGSSPRWESKKWGRGRYAELISLMMDENYEVYLLGSNSELDDALYIMDKCPEVINLVGKTDLNELKSVLKHIHAYIGNDSGPSHMAAAVGCKTISIFGSTGVKHCVANLQYSGQHICLKPSDEISCHPCYLSKCPTQHECMQSILPQIVFENVKKLLGEEK